MSEPPSGNGDDGPGGLDFYPPQPAESADGAGPGGDDGSRAAGVGDDNAGVGANAASQEANGESAELLHAEAVDGRVLPADGGPITLGYAFTDAGGSDLLADSPHEFTSARIGLLGRCLLRIIGVDTSAVPAGEQWKLYGLAATVLLNAALAAVFVPIGASVAYGTLSSAEIVIFAALGGFTIGVIDALVVGQWHSYARHFTSIDPAAPMPKMPGTLRRCAILAPRLLVTAGLVFTLGLLLTLAVNRQAVRQSMATQDAEHNKATRASLLAPDNAAIAKATKLINQDSSARLQDIATASHYQKLASCESLGFPIVPGCSGHLGFGKLWSQYSADARVASSAANTQQQNITTERTARSNAQANETAIEHSPQYKQAMISSTGIIAATSAYDAYVRTHNVPWYDAWRMGILLAVLDLTPLLIKLGSGTTQYEAELWWRAHRRALLARAQDDIWLRTLKANQDLHDGVARIWVPAGIARASDLLARGALRPVRPAEPPPLPPSVVDPSASTPTPTPNTRPAPDRGENPFNLGRNAQLGDVIQLSDGEYVLLTQLAREQSRIADVFIGVEVPKPGQRRPNARNRNPVRAIKLTRLDEVTGGVVQMSDAEIELLDNFPSDNALLEPSSLADSPEGRIAYTMNYHPRGDIERYAYGGGPDRPRLTNANAVAVGLAVVRGLQRLWDMGLVHNDARLPNILLTGPLRGDSDRMWMLAPQPHDRAVLTDYNFVSRVGGSYHDPPGLVVNALEGDPALVRWMLTDGDRDGVASPLGLASDCYAPFAVVYTLLTGGLSPTAALLRARGWSRVAMQQFGVADTVDTWRGLLADDPDLLRQDPPSLATFGVEGMLAQVIDAGVRADPLLRQPQIAGAGDVSPSNARSYIEDVLSHARDSSSGRWLRQSIPKIHEDHPWHGLIQPPVGFPDEVVNYLGRHWPAFVKGGAP